MVYRIFRKKCCLYLFDTGNHAVGKLLENMKEAVALVVEYQDEN